MLWFGSRKRRTRRSRQARSHAVSPIAVRANFDLAQTSADNRKHWANADALSADAAASAANRRIIRNRTRYEVANNSYARGILRTLTNDTVGTGPRLQMLTSSSKINNSREAIFQSWAREVDLMRKLYVMRMARAQDGEAFMVLATNPSLRHPVKLFPVIVEAEQVATPDLTVHVDDRHVDGMVLDEFGTPTEYHVLRRHPGGSVLSMSQEYERIAAEYVIHWYLQERPGQHRGLPEIMSAVPLFAQLRRYTSAVIGSAEKAADIAFVMSTNIPAEGEAMPVEQMTEMEFVPNMGIFAPEGWEPKQLRAEQPTTAYTEFKKEIINEIARCISMPLNIATCNSAGYNYASGRLDHQTYYKAIRVTQRDMEVTVLDRILTAFIEEASRAIMFIDPAYAWPHTWFWDGTEHVDPAKEATAQAKRLENHTTTLAIEYARQGLDWEQAVEQRAREAKKLRQLGLIVDAATSASASRRSTDGEAA